VPGVREPEVGLVPPPLYDKVEWRYIYTIPFLALWDTACIPKAKVRVHPMISVNCLKKH